MFVLNGRHQRRLEAAQMKFLRPLLGFTKLDHQRNAEIRERPHVQNIVEDICDYQKNKKKHLERMQRNRLPKQVMHYNPTAKRYIDRPRKRWKDQL
jgi:hypothetical protein